MSVQTKKKFPVELASIAGLMSVFVFIEIKFGVFAALAASMSEALPVAHEHGLTVTAALWIGLAVYSARRRYDLSREIRARQSLEIDVELARIIDEPTGLPNKLGFDSVVTEAVHKHGRDNLSIAGFEIANFEALKTSYGGKLCSGVEFCNKLSALVADRLVEVAGMLDFIARGEGATFYVALLGEDVDRRRARFEAFHVAFEALCADTTTIDNIPIRMMPASALVSPDMVPEENPYMVDNCLRRLHFALRRARNLPGHLAHFSEEMEEQLRHRAFVEANLEAGICNGEIVPYFQPFIDLKQNKIVGFEVLARWRHPTAGLLMPALFIPIAEDMGLLGTATLSILDNACRTARDWIGDMRLAINISPTDLCDTTLMRRFVNLLDQNSIPPGNIEIEITENAFIEEATAISAALMELKNAGIKISIDDFGTGYSSLHHLRILPFDKIKIDQSFIKDMLTNSESRSIVEAIIALAASLGLPTTAEGIESDEYREALYDLGCTIGQGYLFAKPIPPEDVAEFLANFEAAAAEVSAAA
ncbi:MAG: hypothetical protein C0606_07720 [Hyphomicrobiales bacterium]|nr:MAG: hypothetical protein C0606_07720 [Hyphomicrobiales bacterium]